MERDATVGPTLNTIKPSAKTKYPPIWESERAVVAYECIEILWLYISRLSLIFLHYM